MKAAAAPPLTTLLALDVAQAQVVEQAADQLLLAGRSGCPGSSPRASRGCRWCAWPAAGPSAGAPHVGVLELAEVEQGRAAERQHEGVKVDRRQRRRASAEAAARLRRRRRRRVATRLLRRVARLAALAEAAPIRHREPALSSPESPMAGRLRTPPRGFNDPGARRRVAGCRGGSGLGPVPLDRGRRPAGSAASSSMSSSSSTVGLRAAVDALLRHVLEGLEMLLVVLAGEEALLDVALDRAAVVEARGLRVLVTSHGAFS